MKRFLCLVVFLTLTPALAQDPGRYQAELDQFERYMAKAVAEGEYVGVSIACEKGGYRWAEGFGFADLENRVRAGSESAYRLASITKTMTAVGVMQLVAAGKINLDDEVQVYVPDFPRKRWPVTIRNLLGHTSGISHYKDYRAEAQHMRQFTMAEALAIFQDWDLLYEPGTRYSYTTYGYNLLGAVIEGTSGQSFGDYMRENVWDPLHMADTRLDDPYDLIPNRVRGYRRVNGEVKNSIPVNLSLKYAGGGTRSTMPDLVKFAQGVSDGRALPTLWLDSMWRPQVLTDGHFTRYGLGWSIRSINGRFVVQHGGAQEETRTMLIHVPAADLTIAGASNFEAGGLGEPMYELYELLTGEWAFPPRPYTGDRWADARFQAMKNCFDDGFAWFDRDGVPLTDDTLELRQSFYYFNRIVEAKPADITLPDLARQLDEGRHPIMGLPFAKVGSYMAAQMHAARGDEFIEPLHGAGVPAFFDAYISLYQRADDVPAAYRFSPAFETEMLEWYRAWQRAWSYDQRNLDFDVDPAALSEQLSGAFRGQSIYPDYTGEMKPVIERAYRSGDHTRAITFGRLCTELYPNSDLAHTLLGVSLLAGGAEETGRSEVAKAVDINPEGAASADQLNLRAYDLARAGKFDAGLRVLEAARQMYPAIANLYDSMGELYLMQNDLVAAKSWYNRALEIDPDFENPKRMLEEISEREAQAPASED
jgi:CubicO group peptidase (beta-lactamase class C family)/tetratricopeptide (TPR) repeat protein